MLFLSIAAIADIGRHRRQRKIMKTLPLMDADYADRNASFLGSALISVISDQICYPR